MLTFTAWKAALILALQREIMTPAGAVQFVSDIGDDEWRDRWQAGDAPEKVATECDMPDEER